MATMQTSPMNTAFNLDLDLSRQSTKKNASGIPSPKMLPDIVGPKQIVPKLHVKTHFKAATSVFLNHSGTLNHKDASDETGRHVEKILNDVAVKSNLQNILDNTSKHVSRLR